VSKYFIGLVFDGLLPVFVTLFEFLPQVVILLTIVSLFENSGFMLGFGCTTLAASAIPPHADAAYKRRLARFLTFIPCSAKLPVLAFICSMILGWTVFGVVFLYVFSVFLGLVLGGYKILQCPRLKNAAFREILINIFKNTLEFLRRISLGVVLAATVLYTMQYFSLLVPAARIFEPFFIPIGLAGAPIIACLAFGLVAKEMIIGAVLSFGVANLGLTSASAVSFIIFVLLYTPCLPAVTAIRAKIGTAEALKTVLFNFAVAYFSSFIVYNFLVII
jgi:ferrous iron transport protein B